MTADELFAGRVRRLVGVSSVALGVIFWLAYDAVGGAWGAAAMLGAAWVTMPLVLASSLRRPHLRYLLVVPASLASIGLLAVAVEFDGTATASLGWWLVTAGVWLGAALGAWFWFRWVPVPRPLDQPFSTARWRLAGSHIALVSTGVLCVLGSRLF
jgi:hypothetical protein